MNHQITIPANSNRLAVIKAFIVFLWNLPQDKSFDVVVTLHKRKRTKLQNNSFHKYYELLKDALNNAGLDMRKVLKPSIDIPWTEESIKEQIWRPVQIAMFNKESTTDLETNEVSQVYEVINRHMSEKHGIYVPFPKKDD